MNAIVVRRATAADAAGLAELRWKWRAVEEQERGVEHGEFVTRFSEWVSDHLDSHIPFLASAHGELVGSGYLAVLERVPGVKRWERLSGSIQSVFVVPEHRGRGIGEQLVDALLLEARARSLSYVSVHPSSRSFTLYRRLGFRESSGVLEHPLE